MLDGLKNLKSTKCLLSIENLYFNKNQRGAPAYQQCRVKISTDHFANKVPMILSSDTLNSDFYNISHR